MFNFFLVEDKSGISLMNLVGHRPGYSAFRNDLKAVGYLRSQTWASLDITVLCVRFWDCVASPAQACDSSPGAESPTRPSPQTWQWRRCLKETPGWPQHGEWMFLGINSLQKEAANSKTSKALAQLQKKEACAFDFSQLWVFWEECNKEAVDICAWSGSWYTPGGKKITFFSFVAALFEAFYSW